MLDLARVCGGTVCLFTDKCFFWPVAGMVYWPSQRPEGQGVQNQGCWPVRSRWWVKFGGVIPNKHSNPAIQSSTSFPFPFLSSLNHSALLPFSRAGESHCNYRERWHLKRLDEKQLACFAKQLDHTDYTDDQTLAPQSVYWNSHRPQA